MPESPRTLTKLTRPVARTPRRSTGIPIQKGHGAWATEEIDGDIVASNGASPSLGLSDLSTTGAFSDVVEPLLQRAIGFPR